MEVPGLQYNLVVPWEDRTAPFTECYCLTKISFKKSLARDHLLLFIHKRGSILQCGAIKNYCTKSTHVVIRCVLHRFRGFTDINPRFICGLKRIH